MPDCLSNTGMAADFALPLVIAALLMIGAGVAVYAIVKRKASLGALALLPVLFAVGFGGPAVAPAAAADPCATSAPCAVTTSLDDVILAGGGWEPYTTDSSFRYAWVPPVAPSPNPEEPVAASVTNDEAALNALLAGTSGLPETLSLTVAYLAYAPGSESGVSSTATFDVAYDVTGAPFILDIATSDIEAALSAASPGLNIFPTRMTAVITVPYESGCGIQSATITVDAPVFAPV